MLYNTILSIILYINILKISKLSFCIVIKNKNRIYVWHFFTDNLGTASIFAYDNFTQNA